MTEEEKIAALRLLIGDVPNSPFYQLFTDDELRTFLELNNWNLNAAVRMAAISASFQLSGWSTRERTGDIEVWSSLSSNYLKALDYLITSPGTLIPNGLMPWAGGISKKEVCANNRNPDVVQRPLENIYTCDSDDYCNTNGCGC
jgi:hypothetical protein